MGFRCKVCGFNTIFLYWSSGRFFPLDELKRLLDTKEDLSVPVCYRCCKNLLNYP